MESDLGNAAAASLWRARANHAGDFVMRMYEGASHRFNAGTVRAGTPVGPGIDPTGPRVGNDVVNVFDFLDSNSFSLLALAGSPRYFAEVDWRQPLQYMLGSFQAAAQANGMHFDGFSLVREPVPDRFRQHPGPPGVAWEFTAQAVATMQFVDSLYGETLFAEQVVNYLAEIRRAQTLAPFHDERGLVASTLDGEHDINLPYAAVDQCLTTPFQCIPERVGLAATTWSVLGELGANVFTPARGYSRVAGDTNGDERVDVSDLNNVRNFFGSSVIAGDANGDGTVDLEDLNAVRNNFGSSGITNRFTCSAPTGSSVLDRAIGRTHSDYKESATVAPTALDQLMWEVAWRGMASEPVVGEFAHGTRARGRLNVR
ncbi:MAG: hypothetical protein SGJ19_09305 [Planctomycetia bacterium]|nr:hypothetical protein [Planctomycetia bacterium]